MGAEPDDDLYRQLTSLASRIHAERGFGQQTLDATSLLHEAWAKVAKSSSEAESRQHDVRVHGGATNQEVAAQLRASRSAVDRAWRFGRAFLVDRRG